MHPLRLFTTKAALVGGMVAALAALRLGAAGQTIPSPTDPLPALLAEVHALRLAMEQSATIAPRVQVTLARLNLQEQRAVRLSTELDQARRQLLQAALDTRQTAERLNDAEKSLETTADNEDSRHLQEMRTVLKRELSQKTIIENELRSRENDAAQLLATEQARWVELNSRLDELERLLKPLR